MCGWHACCVLINLAEISSSDLVGSPAFRASFSSVGPQRGTERFFAHDSVLQRLRNVMIQRLGNVMIHRMCVSFPCTGIGGVRVSRALLCFCDSCRLDRHRFGVHRRLDGLGRHPALSRIVPASGCLVSRHGGIIPLWIRRWGYSADDVLRAPAGRP